MQDYARRLARGSSIRVSIAEAGTHERSWRRLEADVLDEEKKRKQESWLGGGKTPLNSRERGVRCLLTRPRQSSYNAGSTKPVP